MLGEGQCNFNKLSRLPSASLVSLSFIVYFMINTLLEAAVSDEPSYNGIAMLVVCGC